MAVMVKKNPCHVANYAVGRGRLKPRYIVVHYTGNAGDTAAGNAHYFHDSVTKTSAHYFVDENDVVQSVADTDTAWHCGDRQKYTNGGATLKGKCRNSNSIGVELCADHGSGTELIFTERTVANAAELVKMLMDKYSVPIDRVVRHYDVTGKICPAPWVHHPDSWERFKNRLV